MYKLKISPEAKDDLAEIKSYISQELCNPQAAVNLISKITKKIRGLSEHPGIGAPLSSVVDIQTDYRFLVCTNYLIFYRYEDGFVFVSRILYGKRNYTRILFGNLPEDEEK
ncbi:type II toxin-antitoxin system RelE/ParE family toxin [Desulfoscipio gibsoniae]|uniref:Addiction module toxin, RelE/StbE family n=1 Tax=Desulfoscipio gibsoniae DSM 7213 TaxID=767817 RepID=R4KGM6_9FIRM|nr:type II toxin-antitoxin system mRNA interferase toxin, RelE/StbE family [Desulfoscipio gibsoniae]AGK99669.1 addiction module toxin, RelE/StbE family [Desulfoscipio gibsoniae DSM 7213]